jgi:hypothetical protein
MLGDIVGLGDDKAGVVVCCISDGAFTAEYPETARGHLSRGFLVEFPRLGLFHFEEAESEEDLELISRASEIG